MPLFKLSAATLSHCRESPGIREKSTQIELDIRHFIGVCAYERDSSSRQRSVPANFGYQTRKSVRPDAQLAARRLSHGRIAQVDREMRFRERLVQLFFRRKTV